MFLYGVRLLLQQSEVSKTTEHLDLNFVNECLRKLLDNRNNGLEKLSSPSINGNDDTISSRDDLTVNNYAKSFTRNAYELLKSKESLTNGNYGQKEKSNMENYNTSCTENIEALLDLKITEMEERLSKKIDLIESKTNEKLDKILKLLESLKNSNVAQ